MVFIQCLVLYADHTWWSVFSKEQVEEFAQKHGKVIKIFVVNDLHAVEKDINEIFN